MFATLTRQTKPATIERPPSITASEFVERFARKAANIDTGDIDLKRPEGVRAVLEMIQANNPTGRILGCRVYPGMIPELSRLIAERMRRPYDWN